MPSRCWPGRGRGKAGVGGAPGTRGVRYKKGGAPGCWQFEILPATFSPSNLSNNKVSEIEDGAFEGAASVSELHLTANQLESIRSGMFRGLDGLRTL